MELIEIRGLFEMDYGAPSPIVISNDYELCVAFYADKDNPLPEPQERNTIYDTDIIVLKFEGCIKYTFGIPGNESLHGHPYSNLGMKSCSFYELKNSQFIKELQEIEKIHPYYNPRKWNRYRHFILTFHDNMFECIANDFDVKEEKTSLYNQAVVILNQLSLKHF